MSFSNIENWKKDLQHVSFSLRNPTPMSQRTPQKYFLQMKLFTPDVKKVFEGHAVMIIKWFIDYSPAET